MTAKTDQQPIGQLPPLYRFFLNPYRDMRFTAGCPKCDMKLRQRKLPLAIHVSDWGTVVINKTCRYCPDCDLLIAHQDELRSMIDQILTGMEPAAVGRPFFVVGTLERNAWRAGVTKPLDRKEVLAAFHDIREYLNFKITGGWQRQESIPPNQPRSYVRP